MRVGQRKKTSSLQVLPYIWRREWGGSPTILERKGHKFKKKKKKACFFLMKGRPSEWGTGSCSWHWALGDSQDTLSSVLWNYGNRFLSKTTRGRGIHGRIRLGFKQGQWVSFSAKPLHAALNYISSPWRCDWQGFPAVNRGILLHPHSSPPCLLLFKPVTVLFCRR